MCIPKQEFEGRTENTLKEARRKKKVRTSKDFEIEKKGSGTCLAEVEKVVKKMTGHD